MPLPYDSLTTVLNTARARLNDRLETLAVIGGNLLDNPQAMTQQIVNNAWRKMQEFLAALRYSGLDQEMTFTNVPAVATPDPAAMVYIGWTGYWDGLVLQTVPVLPVGFIRPQKLWERQTATVSAMTEMSEVLEGLPAVQKVRWNRLWEWRGDSLWMPGAILASDIRMRYSQYLADFQDNQPLGTTPWYGQPVPILRCADAFADYICREVSIARQDMDGAAAFQASAEAAARLIPGRDTLELTATPKASEYGKMASPRTRNS